MSDNSIRNDNSIHLNNSDIKINTSNNTNKSKDIEDIPFFDKILDDNSIINLVKSLENLGFNHSR